VTFSKLLIANRGEIACRVMRTAHALGLRTVAVYSDADAHAPHVRLADEAVAIGAPRAYLDFDAVLGAARATGADALHPGYGFLSENADFADACLAAGLVWVGPPPAAMRAMAHKAQAKRRMLAAGVACAPGYLSDAQDDNTLTDAAHALCAPLLVKAVAGGGGRGMRLVRDLAELPEALAGARREAQAAFGDPTLMLERLVEGGRHIEVQVFADAQGQVVHLGERDCSTQRRRQKLVEETPSPVVDAALRARLTHDALAAARAVGYVGAGTVEFIVDAASGAHYFLEMNTRLQVEHPVTECVTGLDLVEWQLRVAAGEPLPLEQEEIRFDGHAIEVRLCAEDPSQGFAPQTGEVLHWRPAGPARVDAGIAEGQLIGPHYDSLLAKIVTQGRDRGDAIRRLRSAIEDTPLLGVANNAAFLHVLLGAPEFRNATLHTGTLDDWATQGHPLLQASEPPEAAWRLAAALHQPRGGFRPAALSGFGVRLRCGGTERLQHEAAEIVEHNKDTHTLRWLDGAVTRRATAVQDAAGRWHLALGASSWAFEQASPVTAADAAHDARHATAPVTGTVAAVPVQVGDEVALGAPLVCIEAMKMEMWQHARAAGTVRAVHVAPRDAVEAGALLVELEVNAP
jgi:acetyl/propionyl-CoA carboxylase alpha subunit